MGRRTQVIAIVSLLLIGLNVKMVWKRFFPPVVPHVAKDQQMMQQVVEWEALPTVPLSSGYDVLATQVRNYPQVSCREGESNARVVQLSQASKNDLIAAVAGLLQCYQVSTPRALIDYMTKRGQKLDPEMTKLLKEELVKDQHDTADALDRMTDEELLTAIWDWHKVAPRWSGILDGAGSVCVWQCRLPQNADTASLGRSNRKLFENETNFFHAFRPARSLEDACKAQPVLMADVEVVIEHDDSRDHERSPYYVRFWFSPATNSWQPLQMKLVTSSGGGLGLADRVPHIFF